MHRDQIQLLLSLPLLLYYVDDKSYHSHCDVDLSKFLTSCAKYRLLRHHNGSPKWLSVKIHYVKRLKKSHFGHKCYCDACDHLRHHSDVTSNVVFLLSIRGIEIIIILLFQKFKFFFCVCVGGAGETNCNFCD